MSDIKVGDLVMVVRGAPCCGYCERGLGEPFIVAWIDIADGECNICGDEGPRLAVSHDTDMDGDCCPISCVIRIDPSSDLERVTDKEELTV